MAHNIAWECNESSNIITNIIITFIIITILLFVLFLFCRYGTLLLLESLLLYENFKAFFQCVISF